MSATAYKLTQMYSDLTGRPVSVVSNDGLAASKAGKVIGVYKHVDDDSMLMVRVDLALLGSIGGSLVGLPEAVVQQQVKGFDLSETLCDSMHEVLNITAAVISPRRAVLQRMITDPAKGEAAVREMTCQSHRTSRFLITRQGGTGGQLELIAPFW